MWINTDVSYADELLSHLIDVRADGVCNYGFGDPWQDQNQDLSSGERCLLMCCVVALGPKKGGLLVAIVAVVKFRRRTHWGFGGSKLETRWGSSIQVFIVPFDWFKSKDKESPDAPSEPLQLDEGL